jgi:hypothetical protein
MTANFTKKSVGEAENSPPRVDKFVGSAVVVGASYGQRATVLQLITFAGEYVGYTLDGLPDHEAAAESYRSSSPLSIKIQESGQECWAITLTPDGPRRSELTLGAALALHEAGVHAVVEGGQKAAIACSAHRPPTGHLKPS